MRLTGSWPDRVTLRRGWSRADGRPWNSVTADAHLRLVRGGHHFLAEATAELLNLGVERVLSPPLLGTAQGVWRRAGYDAYLPLVLMRMTLDQSPARADYREELLDQTSWDEVLAVDAAAFQGAWRINRLGLEDAISSTPKARLAGVRVNGTLTAFAVTGVSGSAGYLQRVAVDPRWQRRGIGRSLTRSAALWLRRQGASLMLLNTQPENEGALRLYQSEGFSRTPDSLAVLAYPPHSVPAHPPQP